MNWKKVKLTDVLFFQEGPGVRNTQFREVGVKLLNVGNINDGRINLNSTKINISEEEAYGKYEHFLVDEGDLVIASSGIVVDNFHNKIAFIKKEHLPLCMNTSTIRFKSLEFEDGDVKIDLKFFAYYLQTTDFKNQLRKLVTGSAQLNFGPSHLKQINCPLPDLTTQQHIAKVLDQADALRQQNRQLLAHYDELLQSTFIDMFGDPVKNEKGWEVKKVETLADIQGGLQVSAESRKNLPLNLPYLRVANVFRGYLDLSEIKTIALTEGELIRVELKKNDLLIVEGHGNKNEIGRVAIWDGSIKPIVHQNHLIRVRVDSNQILPTFLCFFINSESGKQQLHSASNTTSGLNTISTGKIKNITLPVPPLPLQQQFAQIVEQIEEQKAVVKQSLAESEVLFEGLLAEYFG